MSNHLPVSQGMSGPLLKSPSCRALMLSLLLALLCWRPAEAAVNAAAEKAKVPALVSEVGEQNAVKQPLDIDIDIDDGPAGGRVPLSPHALDAIVVESTAGWSFRLQDTARARAPPVPISA